MSHNHILVLYDNQQACVYMPPINTTPCRYLRVMWNHTPLYSGSRGRW